MVPKVSAFRAVAERCVKGFKMNVPGPFWTYIPVKPSTSSCSSWPRKCTERWPTATTAIRRPQLSRNMKSTTLSLQLLPTEAFWRFRQALLSLAWAYFRKSMTVDSEQGSTSDSIGCSCPRCSLAKLMAETQLRPFKARILVCLLLSGSFVKLFRQDDFLFTCAFLIFFRSRYRKRGQWWSTNSLR